MLLVRNGVPQVLSRKFKGSRLEDEPQSKGSLATGTKDEFSEVRVKRSQVERCNARERGMKAS